jgi:hypothetical protein
MPSPYTPVVASPSCGNLLNLDNLHFTADELRSLNELMVTAVLESPSLSLLHTLVTGIKNDKRIGLIPGTFGLVGKAAQSCNPVPHCYENIAIEKTWEPKYLEIIIDMCVDEVQDTLMRLALNCGVDVFDLTKTQIFEFILGILTKDIEKMIFRHVWFGDQAAANAPGGVITPGVDVGYFNVINGFFQQLAVIYTATPARQTAIAENYLATTNLQINSMTNLQALAYLDAVVDNAAPELTIQPDRILLVTHSIFQKAYRALQTVKSVFCDCQVLENGFTLMKWDGIPMYSIPLWDQWIMAYENNGVTLNVPNRIVYTTKSNLNVGMACNSLFDRVNSFYDQRSRINRIEAVDAFDAKIYDDRLVQVGI